MSIYGLSEYGAEQAMGSANVLPNGTDKWVALLTTLPTARDGTGLVEATGSGYARINHALWVNVTDGNDTLRKNSGAVTFAALSAALTDIVGWAIYDLVAGVNLIAFGPLVDGSNNPITVDFANTDQPQFADQELEVSIGGD